MIPNPTTTSAAATPSTKNTVVWPPMEKNPPDPLAFLRYTWWLVPATAT